MQLRLLALTAIGLVGCSGSADKGPARTVVTDTGTAPTGTASCQAGDAAVRGPHHFPTVGEALSTSSSGDTIRICAGDWEVDGAVGASTVTVLGDPEDASQVTLRPAGGAGTILRHASSASITLRHLTLTGATDSAIRGSEVSELLIEDCIFRDNASDVGGGALTFSVRGGTAANNAVLRRVVFDANEAPRGGAVELALLDGATVTLEDSQLTGNTAADAGGAVFIETISGASTVSVRGSTLSNNTSGGDGGAFALGGGADLVWESTVAEGNQATDAGAALVLLPPPAGAEPEATLTGGRFASNTTPQVLSGAIHLEPGWRLEATDVDLAGDADDNEPKDVNVCGNYDGVVSFTVGAGGCQ